MANNNRTRLVLDNIKCDGCGRTISKALMEIGLKNIVVDPETSSVEMDGPVGETQMDEVLKKLKALGYPLIDTEEGLKAVALRAKSYLSCALGKISKA